MSESSSFFRLHPNLRHAIVHDLGWRELRPVQDLATAAILDGCNTVVLAPTAGGKTEAGLFPVLSRILSEELRPVCALYICPIRALLNNQEDRVQRYARMVGLDSFKWHGDVNASVKARFLREPKHVLLITPESLEVMLISQRTDARALFAGLSAVIIDEIHAFAGDDRGAHLMSVLERLVQLCGRDVQRIGLSATVGNPDEIGGWLAGSSGRPYRRVDPPRGDALRDFRVDRVTDVDAAAAAAAKIALGKKSLVFVESRSQAERVAAGMSGRGVEVFVHHSALSRADRTLAEERFTTGTNTAIVCTSTMELGIDVGDLDHVLQIDAPSTVASLLQRMGRTGRRDGTRANCSFFCQSAESLVQATALVRLAERGWVEDMRPDFAAAQILAHQILALCLQEQGVSRHQLRTWLAAAAPFRDLSPAVVQDVVDTMLARDILHEVDGRLVLGAEGEKHYGRRNFFELYAVFDAPDVLRVVHGGQEVGAVQGRFINAIFSREGGGGCFRLGGRSWQVVEVQWSRGVCRVVPAESGRVPNWLGTPTMLSQAVCTEIRRVLADDNTPPWLTPVAATELGQLRDAYDGLVDEGDAPLESEGETLRWHTFAGGAINRLLALGLEQTGAGEWVAGNWSLKPKRRQALSEAASAVAQLPAVDWTTLAAAQADDEQYASISKFQRCLPPDLASRLVATRVFDAPGTAAFLIAHQGSSRSHAS